MKHSMKWLADILLILIIAVLAALALYQRPGKTVSFTYQPVPNEISESRAEEQKDQEQLATPIEIAVLFGWREKTREKTAEEVVRVVEEKEPPVETSWFKPMGFVGDEEGSRSYLFKDSRTGKVLSIALGSESRGWKLLKATDKEFLLEFEGKKYIIKQNK